MQSKSHRSERVLLLVLLLVFLAGLKASFNPGMGRNSLDGDYYYQVARHVAEGDGLMTSVSLYHQGFKTLPHRTNIYPIWPLTLGWVGKVVPLPVAAALLPELLYLLDLVLLYLLANRLMARLHGRGDPSVFGGGVLTLGHLAVVLFGTNPVFFNFTSLPYTEALAFAFILGTLLAVDRATEGSWKLWAPVAGGLAGIAFLVRSQALGLVLGVVVAFLLVGIRRRTRLIAALLAAVAFAAVLAPWVIELASFMDPFEPRALIHLGAYRETPEVMKFQWTVPTSSGWEVFRHRLAGLAAAFDPREGSSYIASFGLAAWLVPLALLALAFEPRRLREALLNRSLVVTTTVLAGLAMVAPLHRLHTRFLGEWRFGHRHGLPLMLILIVALGYLLLRNRRALRVAAMALVLIALVTGTFRTTRLLTTDFRSGLLGPEPELVAWLDAQQPGPIVLTTHAQTLSVFSRAGFHWMECRESPEQTRRLLENIDIDYVLVYAGQRDCNFCRDVLKLPEAAAFGEGARAITVYDSSSLFSQ